MGDKPQDHVLKLAEPLYLLSDGHLIRTVASRLTLADLEQLRFQGARPASTPPSVAAMPAGHHRPVPPTTPIEVDRIVDQSGVLDVGGHRLAVGAHLAGHRVTLRLDGHLVHVLDNGVLAKTLPSPIPAPQQARLRGAPTRHHAVAAATSRPTAGPAAGALRRQGHGRPPGAAHR